MESEKRLMAEAAILYYEKKCTQQEIADTMGISRQTVSRLLNDAIKENIVEIKIHNPQSDCKELEEKLVERFSLKEAVVCSVSKKSESLRSLMTVKAAADYLAPVFLSGNKKIGVSWGRTVQALIEEMQDLSTVSNTVFPLFGATDHDNLCFSSNELARNLAEKIGAGVNFAWFPYLADNKADLQLLKNTSYYKKMSALWGDIDVAIVGIGNRAVLDLFCKTFGYRESESEVIGDIATHFFDSEGNLVDLYSGTLCASADNIKNAKKTVAIACGNNKSEAICAALKTGLIDTLVTDEYTAKQMLGEN